MSVGFRAFAAMAAASFVASCASPYFVHDPQTVVINRAEVPRLLKSLRCEIATFVAANNQRRMLFAAETKVRGINSAIEKYRNFELDPKSFGGVALDLKIQDSGGLQSGTTFNEVRTRDAGIHEHFLNIGPTLTDQSTYEANWGFIIPQDTIDLSHGKSGPAAEDNYSCYARVPVRDPIPFGNNLVASDLEALAADKYPGDAQFKRVMVNGMTPLAAWLLDVSASITLSTSDWRTQEEEQEHMVPGQMIYTFTVQVTGGLDVKYGLITPLWPMKAAELSGQLQKTNQITITLNGLEAAAFSAVGQGNELNTKGKDLPIIPVATTAAGPHPSYINRTTPRGVLKYPVLLKLVPAQR